MINYYKHESQDLYPILKIDDEKKTIEYIRQEDFIEDVEVLEIGSDQWDKLLMEMLSNKLAVRVG